MDNSISELVTGTLTEMGLPAQSDIIQTLLMKDRHFAGFKFAYNGGYAVLLANSNTLEFYDDQGRLLKTVAVGEEKEAA